MAVIPDTKGPVTRLAILLAACLVLGLPAPVTAQDPLQGAPAETATAPDPAALPAQWWDYLGEAGDAFPQRETALRESLLKLKKTLVRSALAGQAAQVDTVLENLGRYVRLRDKPVRVEAPVPPVPDSFALEEIYVLAERIPELELDHSVTRREVERLGNTVKSRKQTLDRERLEYLELAEVDPARLSRGLGVMRGRLELEALKLVLADRQDELTRLENHLRRTRETLQLALRKVRFADDVLPKMDAAIERLRGRVAGFEVMPDPVVTGILAESELSGERDRAQLYRQVNSELRASRAEAALRLALGERALAAYLLDAPDSGRAALRGEMESGAKWFAGLQGDIVRWSEFLERQHVQVSRDSAADGAGDAAARAERTGLLDAAQVLLEELEDLALREDTLQRLADLQVLQREGYLRNLFDRTLIMLKGGWEQGRSWFTYTLFEISDTPVTPAGLFRVVLILFVAWWFSFFLRSGLRRLGERTQGANKASLWSLGRVLHYVILFIGLLIGLSSIGIDFTKFALLVSALGVGIGFGLQNIVNDVVSGLIILFERSLKIGDFVELESGVFGEVREINIRSTRINTNDNVDILVPNSEFVNGRVTNLTLQEELMRVRISFGVAYGSDKEKVKRAALKAAGLVPFTLDKPGYAPSVFMTGFGDSSLDFQLLVWIVPDAVRTPGKVQSAYLWELETQLVEHGIEIPFPQRDLHLRSGFGGKDQDEFDFMPADPG